MAGGSKRVPTQEKGNTKSKSKDETQEEKGETQIESKPDDDQISTSSTTTVEAKGKEKKHVSPKEKSPMEAAAKKGRAKGIVIGEAKEPETEIVEKSGMKRKREFVVKSSYYLRSRLKGTAVDIVGQQKVGKKSAAVKKIKGKKKREKETDEVDEEGSSCKRQSKRIKRNDDKDKDDDGSKTKRALSARASNN